MFIQQSRSLGGMYIKISNLIMILTKMYNVAVCGKNVQIHIASFINCFLNDYKI